MTTAKCGGPVVTQSWAGSWVLSTVWGGASTVHVDTCPVESETSMVAPTFRAPRSKSRARRTLGVDVAGDDSHAWLTWRGRVLLHDAVAVADRTVPPPYGLDVGGNGERGRLWGTDRAGRNEGCANAKRRYDERRPGRRYLRDVTWLAAS